MAGRHGFEQTGDRHRAPTFSFPRNADPRNSPPLQIRGSTITAFAEPRNLSQSATLNHDDFEDEEDDASENYTHTSKTYSTNDGDIEQRLRVISLEDGPSRGLGIDPGKNDKEIARSYAEAVKCSPRTSHTQPTQEAPSSDHSKHPVRDSATLQRRGPAYKKSAQSLQEIVGKAVRLRSNVRQDTATNRTEVGIRNEGIEGTNRSVARGGPLEEKNKYHTIRHGYPANRNHTYPTPIAHDYQHSDKSAAHHAVRRSNSVPGEESTSSLLGNVLPNSWLLNTKGIGHWADEPSRWYDRPSLKPDIPRIVSTTSPEYRKLITLEAVAQCASGNSNSAGSKKPSAQSSKSRVGRQPGSGKGGKRPAGNGRDRKDNAGEDEGDGNDGNRKKDSQSPRGDSRQPNGPKKWYACHFHKHDPLYFSINDFTGKQYKTCAGKWTDISRLKEHLYRVHTDPPTCDRCQKKFADEGELTAHLPEQGALRCPLTDRTSKGIHRKVGEQLRKRPQRNMTSEDRWWAIWALLFPKEERPNSPYSDLDGPADPAESDTFHLFLEQRMARQLGDNFSASLNNLNGLNLTLDQKRLLTDIAVEQERISRQQLLGCYEVGQTLTYSHISDNDESQQLTTALTITDFPLEFQYSSSLYLQPTAESQSNAYYPTAHRASQSFDSLQPTTPFSQLPRPSTPAQHSSTGSGKSADSAYYSNLSSGVHSAGLSDDGKFVDPAIFAHQNTPTPQMNNSRRNIAPLPAAKPFDFHSSNTNNYGQKPTRPFGWPSVQEPVDTTMYDGLSDRDAPHYTDHTS